MGVHFYKTSPSGPDEQRARLGPPTALLKAGIPSVVWAEDALSVVHRVPTALLDQQLLVSDNRLEDAAQAICAVLPYTVAVDDDPQWKDYGRFNKDRPHAFDLNRSTIFLQHHNPTWAWEHVRPVASDTQFIVYISLLGTTYAHLHTCRISLPFRHPRPVWCVLEHIATF